MDSISKQYNNWAEDHDWMTLKYDQQSRKSFYSFISQDIKNKNLLDVGCGNGHDLVHYRDTLGAHVSGVDPSEKQVELANKRLNEDCVKVGYDQEIPFKDNSFDIIVSKWALQGFKDIPKFYQEAIRLLRPGGELVVLATHPMRHFLEKTEKPRDYFKKEIVTSWIYDHTLPLQEYSHTFNEYFSPLFFEHFELEKYSEEYDEISSEHIDNERYPGYFIYRARKK